MLEIIQEKLREIEVREQVTILHCVESGSRAWGFASPDSDYDVRFIYLRRREDYLRLDTVRDVIEWQLDDVLDINGWDVQKYLRLLYRSNPTAFEWGSSPVIYKTTPEWEQVAAVSGDYFYSKPSLYHYLSMAKSNYREYLHGEEVRLKKYFYVLRPLLACRYILDRNTPPPMRFDELSAAVLPEELQSPIGALLALKRETPELGTGKRIGVLNDFIDTEIPRLEGVLDALPGKPHPDWMPLNALFLSLLL